MVENLKYPRTPGSMEIAEPSALVEDAPFGHCAACSSVGIEDGPSFESDIMLFICSDTECRTYYYERRPTDDGGYITGKGSLRTTWSEKKSPEVRALEENMESWNITHFTPAFISEYGLV